jgi:hypothetical protein
MVRWGEDETLCRLLDAAEFKRPVNLATLMAAATPAVYVWTLIRSDIVEYRPMIEAAWPCYVGSAKSIHERVLRHRRNLADTSTIDENDVAVAGLEMPSHPVALYAEALLTKAYSPIFNVVLPGLGSSRDQGRHRRTQRRSPFAEVHGRLRCGESPARVPRAQLLESVTGHLRLTIRGERLAYSRTES